MEEKERENIGKMKIILEGAKIHVRKVRFEQE